MHSGMDCVKRSINILFVYLFDLFFVCLFVVYLFVCLFVACLSLLTDASTDFSHQPAREGTKSHSSGNGACGKPLLDIKTCGTQFLTSVSMYAFVSVLLC